jgi:hypothetical protein
VAACAGVVEPPAGDERADAGGPVGAPDEAEREGLGARRSAVESPPGGLSESQNRDRLLDTLAEAYGRPDRCAEWASMGPNQQGVFLTLTDLMYGSWMYRPPVTRYLNTNSAQGNCIACQHVCPAKLPTAQTPCGGRRDVTLPAVTLDESCCSRPGLGARGRPWMAPG